MSEILKSEDVFPCSETIPKFTSVQEHRQWLLEHMAGAFRVFARRGYSIGSAGHISVRDPGNPNMFWLNPLGRHFGTLKASDMVLVDHEGNVAGGSRLPVNKAGFEIHAAIHRARPDVIAACHTHSIYGKAYSAFGKPLDMLNQDVCVFYRNHTVYQSCGGVVLSGKEGKQIADALGPTAQAIILQNHGILTVADTVDGAAALFIYLEQSCKAQLLADASKYEPVRIPHEEAEFTQRATGYSDALYAELQPDLGYEAYLDPSYKN